MVAIFPITGMEVSFSKRELIMILLGDAGLYPIGTFATKSEVTFDGENLRIVLMRDEDEEGKV